MPRGAKPGERRGGRTKGTPNKRTKYRKQIAEHAAAEGIEPLALSLRLMRRLWNEAVDEQGNIIDKEKAMQAHLVAKDCAPFVHPKLSTIEAKPPGGAPFPRVIERIIVNPRPELNPFTPREMLSARAVNETDGES